MITIKTKEEIEIISEGGKILASILNEVSSKAVAGVSTKELDSCAFDLIKKAGGTPSFLGYKSRDADTAYPASLCVSINNEIVHGIPSKDRILKDGDIVSLDFGMKYKGLFTDMAVTLGIGAVSGKAVQLMDITKKSLREGIKSLRSGVFAGDYGFTIETIAEKAGFSVVRDLVGHGVGYAVHEDPDIPNWGRKGKGFEFKEGMVVALEPMICENDSGIILDDDGWTWKTKDGSLSAHFEHTVVIEKDGCRILTEC
ncbi:MAG: type I methionyl aminopeptidase [Candidatus Marinimicrobia bacterium]|nr:type I methionyl aminopeptidase [Candidatus Neomarinimicrobiota bacterium]